MLIARAGLDEAPTGPHAFDLLDPSPRYRAVIRRVLAFLRENLLP